MNKKQVNVISIVFVTIGVLSASLIAYDLSTNNANKLKLISKSDAEKIAVSESWNQNTLKDKSITSKLLHIKNDGFTFLVDHNSLEDREVFMTKFSELSPNQYVWLVTIQGENNREWHHLINAKNGNIIQSTGESFEFVPVNPYDSVENGSFITQARGDVTIKFPKQITDLKSSPFPAKLVVTVGDTVTWENHDNHAHSVASVSSNSNDIGIVFDSGIMKSDSSFSFTFGLIHVGNIDYACLLHPWEVGSVIVQKD